MYEFGWYNLEMDAWVNHEMDAWVNLSEVRIQADSTKHPC